MLRDRDKHLRRLVVSAVFLSVALALRMFFSFYIPLFGETGMRVGVHGTFSIMPSVLFGPLFGGITSGASDVLGFMMRPVGTFMPLMTVVVAGGGALRGGLWLLLRNRGVGKMRIGVGIIATLILAFGVSNFIMLNADGVNANFYENFQEGEYINTSNMFFVSRWLVTRTQNVINPPAMLASMVTTFTWGVVGASIFAFLLLGIDIAMSALLKKSGMEYASVMPLLLAMLISSWVVTSLNTVVLIHFQNPSWRLLPFVVVWLPRIIQTTVTTTVFTYFVALLIGVCKKHRAIKALIA